MKKLTVLVVATLSLSASLSSAHIEDSEIESLNKQCKALAQHILRSRSHEKLVKAQIKEASGDEKKALGKKLEKIQIDVGSSKEEYKLACTEK